MKLIVNPHKIEIVKNPVNEKEVNITKCEFEFVDEITNDFTKEAYFTFKGVTYKQIIFNNECDIPSEVLTEKGQVEVGVVAFKVENDVLTRYNPSPAYFNTWVGSLKDDAENSEPITPSEMEQYEQALQDGLNDIAEAIDTMETTVDNKLNEVDEKLEIIDDKIDDIDAAIAETNNLDLDVSKNGKVATVELTKKDGTVKTVTLSDGTSLMFNWDGTRLGIKTDEDADYTYVDLQGIQGPIGPQGEAFQIKKTYASIEAMNADFDNMQLGDYVMIASSVEVEDNAKLYTRGEQEWIFIADFSGAIGIKGETGATPNIQIGTVVTGASSSVTRSGTNENPVFNFVLEKGEQGQQGIQGETGNGISNIAKTSTSGLIDTYTITFTNGNTTTFNVTNGKGIVSIQKVSTIDYIDTYRITYNDGTTFEYEIENGSVTQTQFDDLEDRVSDVEGNQIKGTATGTEILIDDAYNCRLRALEISKETTQKTTTGKNLFNGNNPYSITGVPTKNINLTAGTYYVTCKEVIKGGSTNPFIRIGETNVFREMTSNMNWQFTISNDVSSIMFYSNGYSWADSQGVTSTVNELMISTTGGDYEPYTGKQPSPSPDYPQEVEVVEGIRNLFDKNGNFQNNYIFDGSGNLIVSSGDSSLLDYIEVIKNNDITINGSQYLRVCEYDSSKTFIKRNTSGEANVLTFKTTNETKYIRLSFATNKLNSIQITEGTSELPYVPYGSNYMLFDDVGKNLFDKDNQQQVVIGTSGTKRYGIRFKAPNKKVSISASNWSGLAYKLINNNEYSAYINISNNTTINVTDEILFYNGNENTKLDTYNPNLQIEISDTPTAYETYKSQSIPLDLDNNWLAKKDDYADKYYIDESTGKCYVYKQWGKVVLDGTEEYVYDSQYGRFIYTYGPPSIVSAQPRRIPAYCTHFKMLSNGEAIANVTSGQGYIARVDATSETSTANFHSNLTTVESFKQFLAQQYASDKPVTFIYPLATPTLIEVQKPTIKLFNGVNNISNSEDADMSITYVKDINMVIDSLITRIETLEE